MPSGVSLPRPRPLVSALLWLAAAMVLLVGVLGAWRIWQTPRPSEAVMPSGPLADGTGYHEWWVLPVIGEQTPAPDEAALLTSANQALVWYDTASHSKVSLRAVAVLPSVRLPEPPDGAPVGCEDIKSLARDSAAATPDGVRLLIVVDHAWACPFGGLSTVGGRWAIATGMATEEGAIPPRYIIHEVGHAIGLGHAAVSYCPVLSGDAPVEDPASCTAKPYGDRADPLGSGGAGRLPTMSAPHQVALGWKTPQVLDRGGVYQVRLLPLTDPDAQPVMLPGGLMLSYRASTGDRRDLDRDLARRSADGVYLHGGLDTPAHARDGIVLPFTTYRQAGRPGEHYRSPDGRVALRIEDVTAAEATVVVYVAEPGGTVEDLWEPRLSVRTENLNPDQVMLRWYGLDPSGIAGARVTYRGDDTAHTPLEHAVVLTRPAQRSRAATVTVWDYAGNVTSRTVWVAPPAGRGRLSGGALGTG